MARKTIYELYDYLPQTNCGECGMTCMGFAGYLLSRDVKPEACPPLNTPEFADITAEAPEEGLWTFCQLDQNGQGVLVANYPSRLYAAVCALIDGHLISTEGVYHRGAFELHRPQFDMLLTQTWRMARHVDAEAHIRDLARSGRGISPGSRCLPATRSPAPGLRPSGRTRRRTR